MPARFAALYAAVVAFFGFKAQSKTDEGPEEMLKKGFERSYPEWEAKGLLKKPH